MAISSSYMELFKEKLHRFPYYRRYFWKLEGVPTGYENKTKQKKKSSSHHRGIKDSLFWNQRWVTLTQELMKCDAEPIGGTVNEPTYKAVSAKGDWQTRTSVIMEGLVRCRSGSWLQSILFSRINYIFPSFKMRAASFLHAAFGFRSSIRTWERGAILSGRAPFWRMTYSWVLELVRDTELKNYKKELSISSHPKTTYNFIKLTWSEKRACVRQEETARA